MLTLQSMANPAVAVSPLLFRRSHGRPLSIVIGRTKYLESEDPDVDDLVFLLEKTLVLAVITAS